MTETTVDRSSYVPPDRRWLRDHTGFKTTSGATLDGDLFGALRFPDGVVPCGTVVAQVTSTRLWGPYDPAATDGRQLAERGRVGHLQDDVKVRPGRRTVTSILDAGGIEARYMPGSPIGGAVGLLDDNVRAALAGRARYV